MKLKKILKENKYISTLGDECFFRRYDEKVSLEGFLIVHVDNLAIEGTEKFVKNTVVLLNKNLTISKLVNGPLGSVDLIYASRMEIQP